ncbi:MAG: Ig-like domain-containing protein [Gemmatimonadota bacterium]
MPEVVRIIPAPEAINVSPDSTISVIFTEPMLPSRAAFSLHDAAGGLRTFWLSIDDASPVVRILPLARLKANTRYTLQIEQAASRDLGEMLAGRVSTSFTTNNQ